MVGGGPNNHALQRTGTAARVLVNSRPVGAVPAVQCWSVIPPKRDMYMADENTELLRENAWPARKFILTVMVILYLMVMGVMGWEYYAGHVGRLAPPFLFSAAVSAACFALLFFAITLAIRPNGKWSASEQGLRFVNASDEEDWQIPWSAINRMKCTPVTLVIWWTEVPVDPPGPPQPHRDALFVDNEQARALIAMWHSRTQRHALI